MANDFSIGCDEAGRGAWAGPIVAAAVMAKEGTLVKEVRDSKTLSEKKREMLAEYIQENFSFGIGLVSPQMIDTFGISYANALAFERALRHLRLKCFPPPNTKLRVDGRKLAISAIWNAGIIFVEKGESKFQTIAAASILAKTFRDGLMKQRALKEPLWQWETHKGYGTELHHAILKKEGPIIGFHRLSYRPVKKVLDDIIP